MSTNLYTKDAVESLRYPEFDTRSLGDELQPVFGYFSGAGWTFGLIEGAGSRVTAQTYVTYQQRAAGETLVVNFVDESSPSTIVRSVPLVVGVDIPEYSALRELDKLTFEHDKTYREIDTRLWSGEISSMDAVGLKGMADFELVKRADSYEVEVSGHIRLGGLQEIQIASYEAVYKEAIVGGLLNLVDNIRGALVIPYYVGRMTKALGNLVGALKRSLERVIGESIDETFSLESSSSKGFKAAAGYFLGLSFKSSDAKIYVGTAYAETVDVTDGGVAVTAYRRNVYYNNGLYTDEAGNVVDPDAITFSFEEGASGEDKDCSIEQVESDGTRRQIGISFAQLGSTFGSNLSRLIETNDPWEALAAGTIIGTIGLNIGEAIDLDGFASLSEAFDNFPSDLATAGIGAISSFLTAELFEALGIEGVVGELGSSLAGSALTAIIQNYGALIGQTKTLTEVLNGINPLNIVGGFIGTKLASELVEFNSIEGQIGASIGGAVGTFYGAKIGLKFGMAWGPVGAAIGAFVGYILGGLIGSLFGGGKASSGAVLTFNESTQEFAVGSLWSRNKGSKDAARSFADSVASTFNGVLAATGSHLIDAAGVRSGGYGTYKKSYTYFATVNGRHVERVRTKDTAEIINHGAYVGLWDMASRLVGGDVYAKRALLSTLQQAGDGNGSDSEHSEGEFTTETLLGNLSTASDYADYLQNSAAINALISAEPESAFSAGWIVTFARALELNLHKRATTDWIGGWAAFLDESADGKIDGKGFVPTNLSFELDPETNERLFVFYDGEGALIGVLGDTIDTAGKDKIAGTAANNIIAVSGDTLANTTGLTINGEAASGASHTIEVAALIDGGAGDDQITGGDLGNDLLGGEGNDILIGGALDDWLFGGAGNDTLYAAAAFDGAGNGDLLDGGDGSDTLYGSAGSNWLKGGTGVDALHGGGGGDVLDGGAGVDNVRGGAGSDQYVFNWGDGADAIFDESDALGAVLGNGDSLVARMLAISAGTAPRNWAGRGEYEADGSVKGGEDALVFGAGITIQNLIIKRSGTQATPGDDLIIQLATYENGQHTVTGDEIVIQDWFETRRKVEYLRFADGEELRIADSVSFFMGTDGADVIIGTQGADFLYGQSGNDVLRGLGGDDYAYGGTGDDFVAGDGDEDWVAGGSGNDKIMGGSGHDTLTGDTGDDDAYGGDGNDLITGGKGNDWVVGGAGDDVFRYTRGDGRDTLLDSYVNNWEVIWQSGSYVNGYALQEDGRVRKNGQIYYDDGQFIGIHDYIAESETQRVHLGAVGGRLGANAGTDTLEFAAGIDIGDVMLRVTGNDVELAITTGESDARGFDAVDDRIVLKDFNFTDGRGIETFVFAETGAHDIRDWALGKAATDGADMLNGTNRVDWITGNGGDDVIEGGAGEDILSGNQGVDTLKGGAGADIVFGGAGEDVLEGGAGADRLYGQSGGDIASYKGALDGVRAFLSGLDANSRDVWIAHFRNEASAAVTKLRTIANPNDIVVGDLILLECLQGARDETHAAQIEAALRAFQIEHMLGDKPAVEAARLYRALRSSGQTPRKTIDVIIGAFCIQRGYQLLHQDRDFEPMSVHQGLRAY